MGAEGAAEAEFVALRRQFSSQSNRSVGMTIRIGTAGWTIPRGVADRFPAEGSSLEPYSHLNVARCNGWESTKARRASDNASSAFKGSSITITSAPRKSRPNSPNVGGSGSTTGRAYAYARYVPTMSGPMTSSQTALTMERRSRCCASSTSSRERTWRYGSHGS